YQNNSLRSNDSEGTAHNRPEIERIIHHLDPGRSVATRKRKTGCRRRGKNATQIRLKNAYLPGEFQRDADFADANRVQPGRISLRAILRPAVFPKRKHRQAQAVAATIHSRKVFW